ncbi:hypothetical protein BQ6471_01713 [Vibrio gazogenes]|nr:hypothetical protein BQ6471_01713 [Vibrio gazogenes]
MGYCRQVDVKAYLYLIVFMNIELFVNLKG